MFMMCRLTGLKHSEKVILDVGDPRIPAPLRKNKQSVTIRTSNGIKEGKRPTPRFKTAYFIWSVPGVKKQNSVSGSEVQWKWSKYYFASENNSQDFQDDSKRSESERASERPLTPLSERKRFPFRENSTWSYFFFFPIEMHGSSEPWLSVDERVADLTRSPTRGKEKEGKKNQIRAAEGTAAISMWFLISPGDFVYTDFLWETGEKEEEEEGRPEQGQKKWKPSAALPRTSSSFASASPRRRSSIPGIREVACERQARQMFTKQSKTQEDGFKSWYIQLNGSQFSILKSKICMDQTHFSEIKSINFTLIRHLHALKLVCWANIRKHKSRTNPIFFFFLIFVNFIIWTWGCTNSLLPSKAERDESCTEPDNSAERFWQNT